MDIQASAGRDPAAGHVLEAIGLSKRYGAHRVLSNIRFTLDRGQSVAVIGENGAGKSTFAKILAGVIHADSGEVRLDGQPVSFDSPRAALQAGVAFIPQELAYVPALTVGENILLGRLPATGGFVSHRAILRRAGEEAKLYGITLEMNRMMASLRLADRQIVEIVKALARRARVLVLDEPTAALSDDESRNLFGVLKNLAAEGVGIVYISHRMDEVHRFSDRVDVFRNGELVASVRPSQTSPDELIQHMLGQAAEMIQFTEYRVSQHEAVLALLDWRSEGAQRLDGINLSVAKGEVVGLFGIRGCGADLVAEGLAGRHRGISGSVVFEGRRIKIFASPRGARKMNLGYVPQERKIDGLVLPMSIRDNLSLLVLNRVSWFGVLKRRLAQLSARELARQLDVRYRNLAQPVGELSGGNQQKVLLASRLAPRPRVLVLHEPTRGVDVGARVEIHQLLRTIAAEGTAILLVTADVEEAVAVSDRLLVMRDGRITAELHGQSKTQAQALRLAARSAA
jgi:ABC-type sugar transport system ATPase subunit